jgi:hypothetical protein
MGQVDFGEVEVKFGNNLWIPDKVIGWHFGRDLGQLNQK